MRVRLGEGYISVAEAARRKGISRAAMYRAVRENRIPHTTILGTRTILSEQDVEAFTPRTRRTSRLLDTRPLWEKIVEIGRSIPLEEWEKVPRDGAKNFRHYLYGAPKVED